MLGRLRCQQLVKLRSKRDNPPPSRFTALPQLWSTKAHVLLPIYGFYSNCNGTRQERFGRATLPILVHRITEANTSPGKRSAGHQGLGAPSNTVMATIYDVAD